MLGKYIDYVVRSSGSSLGSMVWREDSGLLVFGNGGCVSVGFDAGGVKLCSSIK